MKCLRCDYNNDSDSTFCQECGDKLATQHKLKSSRSKSKTSFAGQLDDVQDIIFHPSKKEGGIFRTILAGIGVLVVLGVAIVILAAVFSTDSSTTSTPTDTTQQPTGFPLYKLSIDDIDSEWQGETLVITGVIKNSYSQSAKNVSLKIDFYHDEATTKLFDTRYVTILGAPANGAYSFEEPVYVRPSGKFWYLITVDSAEEY